MLSQVEAKTSQGTLLTLPMDDASGGFSVQDIEGLGPVKATISSTTFAQQDGAQPGSARRETRNIKLTIGLEADYISTTVRDLRNLLYGYFMPKTNVDLTFTDDDGLVVHIAGQVESCDPAIFSKDPAVDISIINFNPDFVELDPVSTDGATVSDTTETLVEYSGSVETGVLLTVNVNRSMTGFTFYNRQPDNTVQTLDFAASLVSGDVLKLSTVPGAKGAILTRSGSDSSLLYGVSPQADWVKLMPGAGGPGENYIRVHASGAAVPFTLSYYNRYGGL